MRATCAATSMQNGPILAVPSAAKRDRRTMPDRLNHDGPAGGKVSRMAQKKRQYGSGSLRARGKGWVIRWWETEIGPDGKPQRAFRYEALEEMSRRAASDILAQRMAAAG